MEKYKTANLLKTEFGRLHACSESIVMREFEEQQRATPSAPGN